MGPIKISFDVKVVLSSSRNGQITIGRSLVTLFSCLNHPSTKIELHVFRQVDYDILLLGDHINHKYNF